MSEAVRIGLIGGTGLGDALGAEAGDARQVQTPFGPPSSALLQLDWKGVEIVLLQRHGPGHVHPPSSVPYRANIFALKEAGVTHIVASGATGSLREQIRPGQLVIPDQVIDKTHRRACTFFEGAAVHVEMAEPFCPITRRWLLDAAVGIDQLEVHDQGTYICMEGPAFSTKAESRMHRDWGGDLIGMTCMPEAKLAREAEMAYALVALPTDYDCWRPHDPAVGATDLLAEIRRNLQQATQRSVQLIRTALEDVTALRQHRSPAADALQLAIWSDKNQLDPKLVEKLGTIWGRYF